MSKSKSFCRVWYCAGSTWRIVASMPMRLQVLRRRARGRARRPPRRSGTRSRRARLPRRPACCRRASSRPRRAARTPAAGACGRGPSRRTSAARRPRRRPPAAARRGTARAAPAPPRVGMPVGREVGVLEDRRRAACRSRRTGCGSIHSKSKASAERQPRPRIAEFRPPRVDEPALQRRPHLARERATS